MSLLGSMIAGGIAGGADAQQKKLTSDAEQQRKLSFAKIQQEYAQQNAELMNTLAGGREEKGREFKKEQEALKRTQSVEDLGEAREYEESVYQARKEDKLEEYTEKKRIDLETKRSEIADAMKIKSQTFEKIKQSDAWKNLPLSTQETLGLWLEYGVKLPTSEEKIELTPEAMKQAADAVNLMRELTGVDPSSPEELAKSINAAAIIIQEGMNAKDSGGLEIKDLVEMAQLTRLAKTGDMEAANKLKAVYEKLNSQYGKARMESLKSDVEDVEATGKPLITISPSQSKKKVNVLSRAFNTIPSSEDFKYVH